MIIVYGADWCEDTRRSLRHLRRLGVAYQYLNVDEDLDALDRAKALTRGLRRTPTIDLGVGGDPLVEPDNDMLTGALVEIDMLSEGQAAERREVQNVGDLERVARSIVGLTLLASGSGVPRPFRWPLRVLGATVALTGVSGWCPVYRYSGVSSLDGPGDRPEEATRATWVAPLPPAVPAGAPATEST